MEVHTASPLIHLTMYGMAMSMCRCVTDASTRTHSNRKTGVSFINSLGLKPFVSIAGQLRHACHRRPLGWDTLTVDSRCSGSCCRVHCG